VTEEQLDLLRDKFVLWDRASREGAMDLRDYKRRCADALKQLLAEQVEFCDGASSASPKAGSGTNNTSLPAPPSPGGR